MCIFYPILRKLSAVDFAFLADRVCDIFFLKKQVSRIGNVAEYLPDGGVAEMLPLCLLDTSVQVERGLRRTGQSPGTAKPPDHSPGNGRRSLVLAVFAIRLL